MGTGREKGLILSTKKSTSIQRRRRLAELYVKGKEIRFDADGFRIADGKDGQFTEDADPLRDDEVPMWITPPNPLQRDEALRDANAARARMLLKVRKDEASAEGLQAREFITSMTTDTLIDYVLTINEQERQQEARRNVLAEDEWKDFESLQDAMRQWEEAGSPEGDEEWEPLLKRDREFGEQLRVEADRLRVSAREALTLLPRAELDRRALEKRTEAMGSQAFLEEFEKRMMFFACRDIDDRDLLFFEDVDDMLSYPEEVHEAVQEAMRTFITDPREAKNSQRAEPGSDSVEPPVEPETSQASTPQEVEES